MHVSRLKSLCCMLNEPHGVVNFAEYRKARLVYHLLTHAHKEVTEAKFEVFMNKMDLLETSIVERLRVEAAQGGWQVSEAWILAESFRQAQKHLLELPVFSNIYN